MSSSACATTGPAGVDGVDGVLISRRQNVHSQLRRRHDGGYDSSSSSSSDDALAGDAGRFVAIARRRRQQTQDTQQGMQTMQTQTQTQTENVDVQQQQQQQQQADGAKMVKAVAGSSGKSEQRAPPKKSRKRIPIVGRENATKNTNGKKEGKGERRVTISGDGPAVAIIPRHQSGSSSG